jgi:hypothetical protein
MPTHEWGMQGSPWPFANSSISVPDTFGEWLEDTPEQSYVK